MMSINYRCFSVETNKQIRSRAIEDIISTLDFINDESRQKTLDALLGSNLTEQQIRKTYENIARILMSAKYAKSKLPYR